MVASQHQQRAQVNNPHEGSGARFLSRALPRRAVNNPHEGSGAQIIRDYREGRIRQQSP